MIICHHVIKDSEVIGIGPLMVQANADQQLQVLYNQKRLFFYVHFKNHSFRIESEWFQLGHREDTDDIAIKHRQLFQEYKAMYEEAKQQVVALIV